jgi:hypothetical protein
LAGASRVREPLEEFNRRNCLLFAKTGHVCPVWLSSSKTIAIIRGPQQEWVDSKRPINNRPQDSILPHTSSIAATKGAGLQPAVTGETACPTKKAAGNQSAA